ncbi:MAG TPA: preprotein translocase subunit SecA [Adlercreutzia equolifaciens]|uniref:preprotein translocase subunit SecA n=1 Tax=Adlercreutzia equolifaciens TaxID=446660 RepID=UPI00242FBCC0|nr:preprotein translocase subunit SecA [Adlercreutzia equolifaciens]HJI12212.1 preprotein translocase subunit SecA [Adlercreutzia equolifaciens]
MAQYISKLLSFGGDRRLKHYQMLLEEIKSFEEGLKELGEDQLRKMSDMLRQHAISGESLDKLLPEAFALVREASLRSIGLRHYDVQLIGAMALNDGCIAEMKTGEGKTLVSTAAGYLNALKGDNVHIVTVNDYLAKRDAEWMSKVYGLLGMGVGLIQNNMPRGLKTAAYQASVTYGTNSEFGFDYLRDNMIYSSANRLQRGQSFAIVDEVDSILIDEARTPLIISGLSSAPAELYSLFAEIAVMLDQEKDIVLDEAKRTVYATDEGLDKVESFLGHEIYSDLTGALSNHLKQALVAEFLFKRDKDYVVDNGEVKIVDGFTGRIMNGRRYSEGLHQALEAKEHVEVKPETQTMATVTLQNYFRMYDKLSGMTGTALTEDTEFEKIYHLPVVPIPTNRPVIRKDEPDFIFRTKEAKFNAVADEVERRHATGQPVLIGTASVKASETLSSLLEKRGVPHEVLNAKEHEREAEIVAQAGRVGAVTVATNMAGRGTDILLGGNRDMLRAKTLRDLGGYTEDSAPAWALHAADAEADYITEREGYAVREFGGLYVIGTERHESRRIDNQLRGRSGRQGDPGESRFYLSLEDDLLRLFGRDRIDKVSEMMVAKGIPDESPLEDELVSKVITTAQKQVESMHFSARKNVLEYDDVMDKQRKAVYAERDAILDGKSVVEHVPDYIQDLVEEELALTCPYTLASDDWDFDVLNAWIVDMTGETAFDARLVEHDDDAGVLEEAICAFLQEVFDNKRKFVGDEFDDLCTSVMLHMMDSHWVAHLTDMEAVKEGIGLRAFGHRDPLVEYKEEAYDSFGYLVTSIYEDFLRTIMHLTEIEEDRPLPDAEEVFKPEDMIYSNVEENLQPSPLPDQGNPLE